MPRQAVLQQFGVSVSDEISYDVVRGYFWNKYFVMTRTVANGASNTAARIRDAARFLFARDGYAAVSMRKIAAEVGVQAGALYNYTPDKQTLLFELMRAHMEELLAAWDAATPPPEAGVRCSFPSRCPCGVPRARGGVAMTGGSGTAGSGSGAIAGVGWSWR